MFLSKKVIFGDLPTAIDGFQTLFSQNPIQVHLYGTGMLWSKPTGMILPAWGEYIDEVSTGMDVDKSEWEPSVDKQCSSVIKKRRSKMNKHKYKKRRKKFKFLRRALGK